MNRRLFTACAAALLLAGIGLAGCVGEGGGYGEVDYYGPDYGGPWMWGHPWYGHPDYHAGGVYVSHPPERHFAPRPEGHAAPAGRGGGDHGRDVRRH